MTFTRFTMPHPTLQRSLACLVLSTAGFWSTHTQAANSDYERVAQVNSEGSYADSTVSNAAVDYVEEVAAETAPAPVQINPQYGQRLMDTIRQGNLNQAKWLLANGADPEFKDDPSGMTPMHLAAKSGWVQLAQLLHEAGGDFTKTAPNGTTYLHIAAASNRLPMVKYLVSLGLDVNALTNKGWTPLHHAARFGAYEVSHYLIQQGSEANRYNSDGFTAQALAQHLNHYETVALLEGVTQVASRVAPKTQIASNRSGRRTLRGFFGLNG
ncbi:MAG: hypothetical protein RLZZ422_73 [Pseudomonadota bacterium]|jgi:ankyrin repeat protein